MAMVIWLMISPAASPKSVTPRISFVSGLTTALKAPRRSALTCPRGMAATGNSLTATGSPLSRASCSVKPTWASGGAMKSVVA